MTNIELINKIILCNNRRDIERLLNKHRIPKNKSKYC